MMFESVPYVKWCSCFHVLTHNAFSKANAAVMRNSLALHPCVGRGRRWPGGGGESLRSGCHSITVV